MIASTKAAETKAVSTASAHADRFDELDQLLVAQAHFWQIRPFHSRELVWRHSHPDLCTALLELTADDIAQLESNTTALAHWLRPWLGNDGERLLALERLVPLPQRSLAVPLRFDTGIPGRKWQQVQALAAVLPAEQQPVLEWCAGKGYLGRLLAQVDGRDVVSLEWQETLCRAGQSAADEASLPVRFVQADALADSSVGWLPTNGQVVALHACGDLHTTLMRHWVASDSQRLTLSPCCYHLIGSDGYLPLSKRAAASRLRLAKLDLQLPLREVVTGGRGAGRKRHIEVLWRLAFDEWQREERGCDQYLPLPAFPKSLLAGSFADFVVWAAQTKGLAPPSSLNEAHWLQCGQARLSLVRRMELVSHLFRRPLEVWLLLDRALYLAEHGARVRIGTFCDWSVTPRNLVIDAQRA